jgi:hypothetical protein
MSAHRLPATTPSAHAGPALHLFGQRLTDTFADAIELPLPPSTNRLWRAGRGRVYRSKRYMSWCRDAGWELNLQHPARTTGAVVVTIAAAPISAAGHR